MMLLLTKAAVSALDLCPCLADVACLASLICVQEISNMPCVLCTSITDTHATIEYAISMPCALDLATCSNP
jgi:hypothetical protein